MRKTLKSFTKVTAALLLIGGFLLIIDFSPRWTGQADITPPEEMKNFDDFSDWRDGKFDYLGTIQYGERELFVATGDVGALLASGPAAYVFEKNGTFYDWTSDMGDVSTVHHGIPVSVFYSVVGPIQSELSTPLAPASLTTR